MGSYETPTVSDYGDLLELTAALDEEGGEDGAGKIDRPAIS